MGGVHRPQPQRPSTEASRPAPPAGRSEPHTSPGAPARSREAYPAPACQPLVGDPAPHGTRPPCQPSRTAPGVADRTIPTTFPPFSGRCRSPRHARVVPDIFPAPPGVGGRCSATCHCILSSERTVIPQWLNPVDACVSFLFRFVSVSARPDTCTQLCWVPRTDTTRTLVVTGGVEWSEVSVNGEPW